MNGWREVSLAEIASLNPRLGSNAMGADDLVSFVPMSAVTAETGSITSEERKLGEVAKGYTRFSAGNLLVAKITPCFENGKIALADIPHRLGVGSTEFHVVAPDPERVDAKFLLYFLRQEWIRREGERKMTGSAGQRRVPESFLAQLKVPLPSLRDQRRIAEVLDRAEALRAKRRNTQRLVEALKQSIFFKMFSDPENPWPSLPISELVPQQKNAIRTGPFGSQLLHSEFTDSGIPVLGIDNVVQNKFVWANARFISERKFTELSRYQVRRGDVLITIMGTCGRCAVVPDDIPVAINTKHLCCITLNQSRCLPEYLHACFLQHPQVQHRLGARARGAVMPGLNMQVIKELEVPLPPISLQQEFVRRISRIELLEGKHRASAAAINALFASLQQRAFRAEL